MSFRGCHFAKTLFHSIATFYASSALDEYIELWGMNMRWEKELGLPRGHSGEATISPAVAGKRMDRGRRLFIRCVDCRFSIWSTLYFCLVLMWLCISSHPILCDYAPGTISAFLNVLIKFYFIPLEILAWNLPGYGVWNTSDDTTLIASNILNFILENININSQPS